MPVDVFISYRGADRVLARRLEQRLRSRWGSRVFRDETSLMAGRSWAEQLKSVMSQANVTLALIGPGWHVREEGEDWVRDELLGAIKAGNPVLPVLVGDPDELAARLTTLPAAFRMQAVKVSGELAGFDLHEIERALRALGAFGERHAGGLGRELSEIVPDRSDDVIDALHRGCSVVVSGASGSGRSALLRRIADAAMERGGLIAAHGIDLRSRSRRTHGVVASWVDDLCEAIQGLPPEDRAAFGPELVDAVVDCGPDLLARQVLRPVSLLPLGNDDSDQKILDAARRPTDRWAPFPPERLVSQSVSVIRQFAAKIRLPLILIVDNVESIDGSSKDLVTRLLGSRPDNVRLVLATSAVRESTEPESAQESVARALQGRRRPLDVESFAGFASISLHDAAIWGAPGSVIKGWLDRHNVRLSDDVSDRFENANPYYTLSALWYLVDNGHVIGGETIGDAADPSGAITARDDHDVVTWVAARADEELVVPSRERLLDHMIEEFVPVRFRSIVEAGSLIGRRFPFSAAYAAAHPPESIDDQPPTAQAIERWRAAADGFWTQLEQVDPDGSVIVCHPSADGERMISLAQVDLMSHLTNGLDIATTRQWHVRLAQYFERPIAEDFGTSPDDLYRNARIAARHWANAQEPRRAADAERVAAELAEEALAYPEALGHYRSAIRLFTQLLARTERRSTIDLVDHEALLNLANCLYRLGQMTRLAEERGSSEAGAAEPIKYFDRALERLDELSRNLHDKRLAVPTTPDPEAGLRRDLPEPNAIRHHIRLCENLRGWVNLELAEWHGVHGTGDPHKLLFNALRHAEAARGEADSRWLLAAASARLARQLLDDAERARVEQLVDDPEQARLGNFVRSHNLAIEVLFQIERVIGLAAVSPEEERNLEESRTQAWMVLGQLFQTIENEPRLAEWAFRRMNDHRADVSDLVDMMTDRRLGLFLLSMPRGTLDARTGATSNSVARTLLEQHERWAMESGIAHEHSGAYLSLALLELVERANDRPPELGIARGHVDRAVDRACDDLQRQDAFVLRGVLHAIEHADDGGVAYDDAEVVDAFRHAGIDGLTDESADAEILRAGWRTWSLRLLGWCPHLKDWIGPEHCLRQPPEPAEYGSARRRFFSELALEPDLADAIARADAYLAKLDTNALCVPSNDSTIWRLLRCRVPNECYRHAERTREVAHRLLERNREVWAGDDIRRTLFGRDIDYAVVVHEWYRSTDPSRLLTLARESNMPIDGAEWASPKLLSGRLAIQVLDRQYGAANEIGQERFEQITSMVTNWAAGSEHAGPLEQIFYVALQMEEPARGSSAGGWRALADRPGELSEAYRMAVDERSRLVRQAGLPLVQDLHLLDVDITAADAETDRGEPDRDEARNGSGNAAGLADVPGRMSPRSSDAAIAAREPERPFLTSS